MIIFPITWTEASTWCLCILLLYIRLSKLSVRTDFPIPLGGSTVGLQKGIGFITRHLQNSGRRMKGGQKQFIRVFFFFSLWKICIRDLKLQEVGRIKGRGKISTIIFMNEGKKKKIDSVLFLISGMLFLQIAVRLIMGLEVPWESRILFLH